MAKILVGLLVISLWVGVSTAQATSIAIVDTGTPSREFPARLWYFEYYGAEFTTSAPLAIQSVGGYFSHTLDTPGLIDIAIHAGNGGFPAEFDGDVIHHSLVEVPANSPLGWYGVSDVNWVLPAGTYWVTFKPAPPWLGTGVSGNMPGKAPNPLDNYVFSFTRDSRQNVNCEECPYYMWDRTYVHGDHPRLPAAGVRIHGVAVPDSTSTLYLVAGVVLLLGIVAHGRAVKIAADPVNIDACVQSDQVAAGREVDANVQRPPRRVE